HARGTPRDHEGARDIFLRIAEAGHSGAMFALGALHGGGHDIPVDRAAALYWYRRAAEADHPIAQLMLGRWLRKGLAGPPDPVEAEAWLVRALAQGIEDARADLEALADASTPAGSDPASVRAAGG
ncbi:MAG: hypothetical protein B7Z59_10805, partial [Acidiphilium sp. 37-67-22]